MTQEMFFLFAEHFISSLPDNSGPVRVTGRHGSGIDRRGRDTENVENKN